MRLFSRFSRIIGLLLVAAALHGCGMVRVAYNQAPDALYWWLDSYFDFNDAQTLRVRADLDALHTWHRRSELPAYADLLRRAQVLAPGDISREQACELFGTGRARALALLDRVEPTVLAIAPTLDAQQITVLEKHLDKRNRKWRGEFLEGSAEKRAAHRVKQAVNRAEMFYGTLQERQLAVIRQNISRSSFNAATSHRETMRRQQDSLSTLRAINGQSANGPGVQVAEARVKDDMQALLDRLVNSPDTNYRAYIESITLENCAAIAELHNSTTPAQRAKAAKTLQGYEEDFRSLSSR